MIKLLEIESDRAEWCMIRLEKYRALKARQKDNMVREWWPLEIRTRVERTNALAARGNYPLSRCCFLIYIIISFNNLIPIAEFRYSHKRSSLHYFLIHLLIHSSFRNVLLSPPSASSHPCHLCSLPTFSISFLESCLTSVALVTHIWMPDIIFSAVDGLGSYIVTC